MPICSSYIYRKQCIASVETLAQSPACRMDTGETTAATTTEAAALCLASRDICVLAMNKTFLTQKVIFLRHTGMCCLLLPQNRENTLDHPSDFLLKGSYDVNKPSSKNRANINIRMRFSVNLKWKMTQPICLATRCRNNNSSMMLQKSCQLSMHSKVKS